MRPQYHFRDSPDGLRAWNVQRLVELSRALPVRLVALDSISELDEPYWYQAHDAQPTCRHIIEHIRLVNAADLSYPVILCADGRLMDGMHRVVKAALAGLGEIKAVRFPVTPEPDYIGIGADDLPYDEETFFSVARGDHMASK